MTEAHRHIENAPQGMDRTGFAQVAAAKLLDHPVPSNDLSYEVSVLAARILLIFLA
jgi:hypothetical protein